MRWEITFASLTVNGIRAEAQAFQLPEGWEPFGVYPSGSGFKLWLRRAINEAPPIILYAGRKGETVCDCPEGAGQDTEEG